MNKLNIKFPVDLDDRDSIRDVLIQLKRYVFLLESRWKRMDVAFSGEVLEVKNHDWQPPPKGMLATGLVCSKCNVVSDEPGVQKSCEENIKEGNRFLYFSNTEVRNVSNR